MKMSSFAKTGLGLAEDSLTKQAFCFGSFRTVAKESLESAAPDEPYHRAARLYLVVARRRQRQLHNHDRGQDERPPQPVSDRVLHERKLQGLVLCGLSQLLHLRVVRALMLQLLPGSSTAVRFSAASAADESIGRGGGYQ
jgi:hypothetical protein